MAGFRDFFSRDSAAYARFRPRYPPDLFRWLALLPASRQQAWDCGTGNGQAAALLAPHFSRVIGTDASLSQLREADPAPNLRYVVGLAETSAVASGSVDLVTVAQALHWLDHSRFFAEVSRVGRPGAALAVWGYYRLRADPEIERAVHHFQDVTVGRYWPPERQQLDRGYEEIELPVDMVEAPAFASSAELTLAELLGYIRTWSAVIRYRELSGRDAIDLLAPELGRAWGDPLVRREIVWPLFVRAGRLLG